MATSTWLWQRTMLERERWIGLMGFRRIERREIMYRKFRARISGRDPDTLIAPMFEQMPFIAAWTPADEPSSRTSTELHPAFQVGNSQRPLTSSERNKDWTRSGAKFFHKSF